MLPSRPILGDFAPRRQEVKPKVSLLPRVCRVFLQAAQARHSERRALARSEESNQACALLNDASGVLLCLGTVGLWAG
jgi:hypothetical protein